MSATYVSNRKVMSVAWDHCDHCWQLKKQECAEVQLSVKEEIVAAWFRWKLTNMHKRRHCIKVTANKHVFFALVTVYQWSDFFYFFLTARQDFVSRVNCEWFLLTCGLSVALKTAPTFTVPNWKTWPENRDRSQTVSFKIITPLFHLFCISKVSDYKVANQFFCPDKAVNSVKITSLASALVKPEPLTKENETLSCSDFVRKGVKKMLPSFVSGLCFLIYFPILILLLVKKELLD